MKGIDLLQFAVYLILLIGLAIPLGGYMAKVYQGEKTFLDRLFSPIEKAVFRVCAIDPQAEMSWWQYAVSLLAFNFLGFVALFILQLLQGHLPFNPQGFSVCLGIWRLIQQLVLSPIPIGKPMRVNRR
ncbi:Potassium-transporting ATPase A chain [Desulfosporosinus sp. BG]|nr:Potassium-transporting ATPase A chain [Desulfosporosinus sp. BG]